MSQVSLSVRDGALDAADHLTHQGVNTLVRMGAGTGNWGSGVHRVPDLGAGWSSENSISPVWLRTGIPPTTFGDALVGHEFGDLLPNPTLLRPRKCTAPTP